MPNDSVTERRWQPGELVADEFKVVRCLGRGGMAAVYLVRNVDLGHRAAVKVPFQSFLRDAEKRAVFSREVQTWISLPKHPHIVQCHFLRERDGIPAVFAEFVSSGSLESWIDRERIRGLHHVLDLSLQLSEAMYVAEQCGIVHRDLKPSNCLIDRAGRLKVCDFGLAASWEVLSKPRRGVANDDRQDWRCSAGTQSYCSPEQFDGAAVNTTTDIWSFAITVYEMISGRRPGLGPAAPYAVQQFLTTDEGKAVPNDMGEFLLELLQSDPAQRPQTFRIVSQRLREFYRTVAGRAYERKFPDVPDRESTGASDRRASNTNRNAMNADSDNRRAKVKALSELAAQQESIRASGNHPSGAAQEILQVGRSLISIARSHRELGNLEAAIAAYGKCIDHFLAVSAGQRTVEGVMTMVTAIHDRGVCRRQSGDLTGAVSDYDACTKIYEASASPDFGHAFSNLFAAAYQNRAMALLKSMRLQDALSDATKAIEIREELVRRQGHHEYTIDLAGTYSNRAVIYRSMGDSKRAIADYSAAEGLCQSPRATGQFTQKDEVHSLIYLNRAALHLASGNARNAKADSDEAIRIFESDSNSKRSFDVRLNLSSAYNNRANANRGSGAIHEALKDIAACRAIRQELVVQDGHTNVAAPLARAYCNEALFQIDAGQMPAALEASDKGVRILQSLIQRTERNDLRPELARLLSIRGNAQAAAGKYGPATGDLVSATQHYQGVLKSGFADVTSGLWEVLIFHAQVLLEWSRPAHGSTTAGANELETKRQSYFQSITQLVNQIAVPLNRSQLRDQAAPALTSLRQLVVSLNNPSSVAGAAAVAAIDQIQSK